ncbi:regulatory protein GntR HTH [Gemmatirosa kalamazoonensis]|uniref:Regulatory protein GntR HTH n=1 Tax=Gemmatirosa kalamazoonensis TaxID=861299 RepID=W0RAM3_9BACT|nr:GntR family transcriptional regulator [Gemmatirosa kalamazoonensis]AHG87831.1 regulatory protein GntR HTH [Gemmatirosa kalamazoonensis]
MPRIGRDGVADALRDRIVSGLHVGRLRGGQRLPSTRALAAEFGVNERVVLAALRTLADEGFVELRPRSGAYVVPPHPAGGGGLPDLAGWLVAMLVQARARGLAPREVSEYVRRALETRRVRAACIECNRDQLHLLCSELAEDHGFVSESVEVDDLRGAETPLAARRADVLVTTLYHATEVQAVADRLGKPWIAVSLRPDVMDDVARGMREGPVYYVATDPRFEAKLRRMLGPLGPAERVHVLVVDRDDLSTIPDDAPTFVMTSARERVAALLGGRSGPGRPIQPHRFLSDDAARALLTFLVRANMAALAGAHA